MTYGYANLKVAVLTCPYDTWDTPLTRDLFVQMVGFKLSGFRRAYPYGVLPVDSTDLVATHLLVCVESDHGLIPLTGCKSITHERCDIHQLPFAGLSLVRAAASAVHEQAVLRIMDECRRARRPLAYASSWTVNRAVKIDRALRRDLRDIFEAMFALYYISAGISDLLGGGVVRMKTDRLFQEWGYRPLKLGEETLPPIHVPHLHGDAVTVLYLTAFTPGILEKADRWRQLWSQRVTI
jgi:hypothetical protein